MVSVGVDRVTTFEAVQGMLRETLATGLVHELLSNAEVHEFSPQDAYVHPNGFWKVRLHGSSLGKSQVRLHYWPAGSPRGDIHDHGWPYASLALRGLGSEEVYRENGEQVATAFSYCPGTGGGFDLGWSHEETRLALDFTQPIRRGQYSGGEAAHIHTFTAAYGSDLLTLVATGEPVVAFSRVFLPGYAQRLESLQPTALTRGQIDSMIADARTSIAGLV